VGYPISGDETAVHGVPLLVLQAEFFAQTGIALDVIGREQ
jgi:hypothetical protein